MNILFSKFIYADPSTKVNIPRSDYNNLSCPGNISTGDPIKDFVLYPNVEVLKDMLQVGKIGMNSKLYMQHIVAIHDLQEALLSIILLGITSVIILSIIYDFSPIKSYLIARTIVIREIISNKKVIMVVQALGAFSIFYFFNNCLIAYENLQFLIENPITFSHGAFIDDLYAIEAKIKNKV
ncbi:unnamed protein product (mitochondrion) [Parajaminaea phylloscopi]|uniref:Uncharacterized protein n=1 Tax=Parajaminaea phylloscopi TaxID=1463510 RepID=A0AB39A6Y8_9BASI